MFPKERSPHRSCLRKRGLTVKGPKSKVTINGKLKDFLEGGVSVIVGTRDSRLVPEITRAWGPSVSKDRRRIRLCIPLATSRKTLENLEENGQIAVSFSLPSNYQTVQLQGRCDRTSEPVPADLAAVERHRAAFCSVNEKIGVPRHHVESFWRRELETSSAMVMIRVMPEEVFDQTPGPDAGSPL
jgi:Pyridoxamine 5'-phosphate oxidase